MPSVSVIIPTFNAARFVERAWHSILRQTTLDWEAIFVDDSSGDGTAAMVGGFCDADRRARLIRLPVNAGPAVARNRGIEAAAGDWIAVLDADDAFDPCRLARLTEAGTAMGGDIVLDNLLILDPADLRPLRTAFEEGGPPRPLAPSEYLRGVQTGRSTFDWGFLKPVLRRGFLVEHRLGYRPEMRFGEDVVFMLDAILAGAQLVLVPDPLYHYTAQWSGAARAYSTATRTTNNYPALIAASRSIRLAARGGAAAQLGPLLASREESLRELSLVTDFRAALKTRDAIVLASCMMRPVRLARGVRAWRRRHRSLREMETRFAARARAEA
jgi:succinoglycan biosynthesis protein ExoO